MTSLRPVCLVAYDPDWPEQARIHGEQIRDLCTALNAVHHIGSTAIPGLIAKPVIDLLAEATDLPAFDGSAGRLRDVGYRLRGENGIANRRYCTLDDESGSRRVHLHVFASGDPAIRRHLAFRDYLRTHPKIATAYETEKLRAQRRHPEDSRAYSVEKSAWIENCDVQAQRWYGTVTG